MSKESARAWKLANPEKAKANHKRWRDANKKRIREYGQSYRAKDPEKFKKKARVRSYRWRDLNREDYLEQSKARYEATRDRKRAISLKSRHKVLGLPQATRPRPTECECCGRPEHPRLALHLDHCHKTNTFRGWICFRCNTAIGKLGDSIEGLERAIAYLKRCSSV